MVELRSIWIVLVVIGMLGVACTPSPEIEAANSTLTTLAAEATALHQEVQRAEADRLVEHEALDAEWAAVAAIEERRYQQQVRQLWLVFAALGVMPIMATVISFSVFNWMWSRRIARYERFLDERRRTFSKR